MDAESRPAGGAITELLAAAGRGDEGARQQLWGVVYDELRSLARRQLAGDGLQGQVTPTTLVHEAYLRLIGPKQGALSNHRHLFGAVAQAMRRIRVDTARQQARQKRGGGQSPSPLADDTPGSAAEPPELLAVDEALGRLGRFDPRKSEIVLLRFFAGLTGEQTAAALGLSARTVDAEWRLARAWLYRELRKGDTTIG